MTDENINNDALPVDDNTQPDTAPDTELQNEADDVLSIPKKSFNERLERAKRSAQNQLLESLGLSSSDELSALVEDYRQRQKAEMTEVERLQQELQEQRLAAEKAALEALAQRRINAGIAAGLPEELAARVRGDDDESIKEDVERIKSSLSTLGTPKPKAPDNGAGAGVTGKPEKKTNNNDGLTPAARALLERARQRGYIKKG